MLSKKLFYFLIFSVILFCFLYFRLKPISLGNFPYTYDQGRDFLKAQEIVLYKNPTFIGPTTGIIGIFHGAWWYYFLSFAFILFNGSPYGFVYTLLLFFTISYLLLFLFLKKEFGFWPSILYFALISSSPYLISASYFAINSVLTIPFIILLIISLYYLEKTKNNFWLFFLFLAIGYIFEMQVSFGIFIIPAVFVSLLIFNHKLFINIKNIFLMFSGLITPFSLRILFELKNNFIQTKTLFSFLLSPRYYNEKSLITIISERINLFKNFYINLFSDNLTALIFFIFVSTVLFFGWQKLKSYQKKFLIINLSIIFFIFIFSLFYKDNFWSNYLEGLSIFYLPFIIFAFYLGLRIKEKIIKFISWSLLIVVITINFSLFYKNFTDKNISYNGFVKQKIVIETLYLKNKNKNYCLKIYTPPVIPYTYQYLIDYYSRTKQYPKPSDKYLDNQCWYIIENDDYQFRIDNWRKNNIPVDAQLKNQISLFKDINLELWEKLH